MVIRGSARLDTSLDLIYPPIRDLSEVLARVPLPSSEWLGVRINDLQASLSDSPQKLFSRNRFYLTEKEGGEQAY